MGGLTVLRALVADLPHEDFLYLGDTARLPYGTKSPGDRGALFGARRRSAGVARHQGAGGGVQHRLGDRVAGVARADFPELPVIGVIEPGARAACEASSSGRIAVLATEGTVQGGAYRARHPRDCGADAHVTQVACQMFVALAEEGWSEGEAVDAVTERYLAHLDARVDTVVLGCTHFPLLAGVDRPPDRRQRARIVDSAATTARATAAMLAEQRAAGAARRARAHCA